MNSVDRLLVRHGAALTPFGLSSVELAHSPVGKLKANGLARHFIKIINDQSY